MIVVPHRIPDVTARYTRIASSMKFNALKALLASPITVWQFFETSSTSYSLMVHPFELPRYRARGAASGRKSLIVTLGQGF